MLSKETSAFLYKAAQGLKGSAHVCRFSISALQLSKQAASKGSNYI